MRRFLFLTAFSAMPAIAACTADSGADIYGPPCAIRAYEAGFCPTPGARVPVTAERGPISRTAFGGAQGERHRSY
ncbi:hypothetical protein [Kumtagia ephedrae]|jgi:hypothetical protein|uniref:Porin n=1 Tax=Kumtagia ephedrae TaxID=2116701 RepID=A0A2P7RZW4_9HYPH|nr:hypothetical protein [Mesorhizobium ephedrae]PSJ55716.1 hypothetical protein C7I84_22925 [Mesorhizobium ephedrae]